MDSFVVIFIKGFLTGLLLCAPFGPVGAMALKHTVNHGKTAGGAAILGGTVVDLIYCSIAGLGITLISQFIEDEFVWIQALAGLVIIGYGLKIFSGNTSDMHVPKVGDAYIEPTGPSLRDAFWSAFLVMAVNPMPILIFTVMFSALGVHGWKGDYEATFVLVAGVGLGSFAWAPLLVTAIGFFGEDFSPERRRSVSRFSGLLLAVLGLLLGLSSLVK
ncbi:MAG: LysE family transporter [Desulfatibacillaceae bacterium]|nr:LysE family transporter [Desulfatibacillaceae bacterium]